MLYEVITELVRASVSGGLEQARPSLGEHYDTVRSGMDAFWRAFDEEQAFKAEVLRRLSAVLPPEAIDQNPGSLIQIV